MAFRRRKPAKRAPRKRVRAYAKPKMKMYKVPRPKVYNFKRERWLDINTTGPGGANWTVEGRTDPDVLAADPLMNFRLNLVEEKGDPAYSRVTWQPVLQLGALPGLGDIQSLYRLYKINKVSITLYPMRATNPTQTATAPGAATSPVAPNLIVTTMFAKTGIDTRITMGTEDFSQVDRKSTKLFNLGIGNEKLGWYFTPSINKLAIKNPDSANLAVVDGHVNVSDAFSRTLGKAGWQDIATGLNTDHHGPLISFRSVNGHSIAGGTAAGNNMQFRACVKYYFSCKGVH